MALSAPSPLLLPGELKVSAPGRISELNNISGTFRWGRGTLGQVKAWLEEAGLTFEENSVRPWQNDPYELGCSESYLQK